MEILEPQDSTFDQPVEQIQPQTDNVPNLQIETLSKAQQTEAIEHLKAKDDKNNNCVDCGVENTSWVCVLNGVFLCLTCAGQHRTMGVTNSVVRSSILDGWTKEQMLLLDEGGNTRASEYMKQYDLLEKSVPLKERYSCKAMQHYRKMLSAIQRGDSQISDQPSYEEGRQLPDGQEVGQNLAKQEAEELKDEVIQLGEQTQNAEEDGQTLKVLSQQQKLLLQAKLAGKKLQQGMGYANTKRKEFVAHPKVQSAAQTVKTGTIKSYQAVKPHAIKGYQASKPFAEAAWYKTRVQSAKAYNYSAVKLQPLKQKLDEKGVTAVAVKTGGYVKKGAIVTWGVTKVGASKVNSAIDANPKTAAYKQTVVKKVSQAGTYVGYKKGSKNNGDVTDEEQKAGEIIQGELLVGENYQDQEAEDLSQPIDMRPSQLVETVREPDESQTMDSQAIANLTEQEQRRQADIALAGAMIEEGKDLNDTAEPDMEEVGYINEANNQQDSL